ncbi:FadR/GntR family transcriptional regulator [Priestia megaterium]|uniref:FadR/GntR family transcriptional regulator n=1 Tax=Priestia megaterium TaxID=1404 RepID=UPI002D805DE0|nr:FadR/GntR family transcriptional regulator [Priestia megaterium]MEB4887675.1 FadR/GntR family transcriptional regulator [Priestia megaterium]
MEPINLSDRKSLKQTVIQEIKQYIIDHQLKAGDKLPTERKFMEVFGVSRSVVREALSYLENTEVIRVRQGQGAFLNESNIENLLNNFFFLWQINNGNIRDILGLRAIFEASAIDEIIMKDRTEEIATLEKMVEESMRATTVEAFREADILFHKQILKATQNQLFIQMTSMITSYFFQVKHIHMTVAEYKASMDEHMEIVKMLKEKDAAKAKSILTKHINNAKA